MKLFNRQKAEVEQTVSFDDEKHFVIEWLRSLSEKDYTKIIKIVEVRRNSDEEVKIIELGSKKAVKDQEKEEREDKAFECDLAKEFMEN